MKKVMIVGDSRQMKGGVSTVVKTMEKTALWNQYSCYWLECQINSELWRKLLYLLRGMLKAFVKMPRYDIIHFMTTPGPGMLVQLPFFIYAILWRKKRIIHLHVGNQLKDYQSNSLFKWHVQHSDLVLTLGRQWMEYVPNQYLKNGGKIDYLYNPSPVPISTGTPQKYFLFAAWFDLNKGYDTLLSGFSKVVKKYPEWRLVMCGVGNLDELQGYIRQNNLENHVDLPGWVTGEEKDRYFRNAYAYCMTSYKEGLPMTVLESMSMGVPVISTRVGCLPEFLEDRKNVLFFDFGNADQLASAMIEIIEDKELRQQVTIAAQDVVKENFQTDVYVSRLSAFYQSLS